MKLALAITILRNQLDDNGVVPGWTDFELASYHKDAIEKLCADTLLLKDSQTVGEVLATGAITLAGVAGQINSVRVNGVTITSGVVPFNSTIAQTATDLASNINAFTSAYTANANNETITLSAIANTGSNPNGYVISVDASGGITATTTALSGGTSICGLWLLPGVSIYAVDERIIAIDRIEPSGFRALLKKTKAQMDAEIPYWRTWDSSDTPRCFIEEENHRLTIWPTPSVALACTMTVFRIPLDSFFSNGNVNTDAELEIDDRYLVGARHYCKHLAYSKTDANRFDPAGAQTELQLYEAFVSETLEKLQRIRGTAGTSYFIGGYC